MKSADVYWYKTAGTVTMMFSVQPHAILFAHLSDLLLGLDGGLGGLALGLLLLDGLDDTDGNGLAHVTDGEAAQWGVLGESLDAHWLK